MMLIVLDKINVVRASNIKQEKASEVSSLDVDDRITYPKPLSEAIISAITVPTKALVNPMCRELRKYGIDLGIATFTNTCPLVAPNEVNISHSSLSMVTIAVSVGTRIG